MLFADGDVLTVKDLSSVGRVPKLMFWHSPELQGALYGPELPSIVAESALTAGIPDFICGGWQIKNHTKFAQSFYASLLGEPLGGVAEAIARARSEVAESGGLWPPDWAAYQHYTAIPPLRL